MLLPLLLGQGGGGGGGSSSQITAYTGSPTITENVTFNGVLGQVFQWSGAGTFEPVAGATIYYLVVAGGGGGGGAPTVRYDWQAADVDTAGFYEAEFEVTYAGGAVETFPNSDFIRGQITGDIA